MIAFVGMYIYWYWKHAHVESLQNKFKLFFTKRLTLLHFKIARVTINVAKWVHFEIGVEQRWLSRTQSKKIQEKNQETWVECKSSPEITCMTYAENLSFSLHSYFQLGQILWVNLEQWTVQFTSLTISCRDKLCPC